MLFRFTLSIFILISFTTFGQRKNEIARLEVVLRQLREKAKADSLRSQKEIDRLTYLQVAREMALRSVEQKDIELGSLLAVQAFELHSRYSGYAYDSKIHAALQVALRNYGYLPIRSQVKDTFNTNLDDLTESFCTLGKDRKVIIHWTKQFGKWTGEKYVDLDTDDFISSVKLNGDIYSPARLVVHPKGSSNSDLLHVGTHGTVERIEGFDSSVEQAVLSYSQNCYYLLTHSGKSILRYDLQSKNLTQVIRSNERILAIELNNKADVLVGAGEQNNLYAWNTKDYSQIVAKMFDGDDQFSTMSFADTGHIVIGDQKGDIRFMSAGNVHVARKLSGHSAAVTQLTFSPNNRWMATSGKDGTIRLWDLTHLNEYPIVITTTFDGFLFSPDSNEVITYTGDEINTWPLNPDQLAAPLCNRLTRRSMDTGEWHFFAGDLPYEYPCKRKY